jgi:hypothetical protein
LAKLRLEELITEIDLPLGNNRQVRQQIARPARRGETTLGTTVTRTWKNREIRATSVESGWEYDGAIYKSLSAIARHVTGAHWNGRYFFGLTKRSVAQ